MRFIKGLPNIVVNKDFDINTLQYLDEDEDRVILQTPEFLPKFIRGYICDMRFEYRVQDNLGNANFEKQIIHVNNLILVHIRRTLDLDGIPTIEYVFYK